MIAQVTGDDSVLEPFANTLDLQPMKQWNAAEARQMAATGHRDKYLHKARSGNGETRPA